MPAVADDRITRGMQAQLADARRMLDRDERPLGWKLGFGTEAAMQKLGIDAPLVGYLPTANRLESGAVVDISNWGKRQARARDRRARRRKGEITAIGAAIELVDLDTSVGDPEAILGATSSSATCCSAGHGGRERRRRQLRVNVNGEEVAATDDVTEVPAISTGSSSTSRRR